MLVDPVLEVNWSSNSNLWSQTGRMTKGSPGYNWAQSAACRARSPAPSHSTNHTGFRLCHTLPHTAG
jgi:hypothetical protein